MTSDFCPHGCYWDCEHAKTARATMAASERDEALRGTLDVLNSIDAAFIAKRYRCPVCDEEPKRGHRDTCPLVPARLTAHRVLSSGTR